MYMYVLAQNILCMYDSLSTRQSISRCFGPYVYTLAYPVIPLLKGPFVQACFEDLSADRLFGRVRNGAAPEMPRGTWRYMELCVYFFRVQGIGISVWRLRLRGLGFEHCRGSRKYLCRSDPPPSNSDCKGEQGSYWGPLILLVYHYYRITVWGVLLSHSL